IRRVEGQLSNSADAIDKLHVQEANTLGLLARYSNEGKFDSALEMLGNLPPQLQNEKRYCVTRVHIARHVSQEEYSKAVENLRAHYPNDLSTDLLSAYYFMQSKQFEAALAAVDRVDSFVGSDPAMDELRGSIHWFAGASDKARKSLLRAIE